MHGYLRQSTATDRPFGPFVEVSDGYSLKATTITMPTTGAQVRIWKSNGNATGLAGAVVLFDPGWARLAIAASDVDQLGFIRYAVGNATNNMPVWREYTVLPAEVYDQQFATGNATLDYVMFTPGVQTITVKDTLRVMAAALGGKLDGATGAAVRLYGPSGEVRVSAAVVSGNRTTVTWVTGIS